MNPEDALLLLVHANGGRVDGRTAIQKLTYFTQLLVPLSREFKFSPHFYGPYSAELAGSLDSLVAIRFLETEAMRTGYQRVMYSYSLSADGEDFVRKLMQQEQASEIAKVLETCRKETGLNADVLSFAAKADYILRRKKKGYTRAQVIAEAKKLGWNLTDQQVRNGVKLLLALRLAKERKPVS